MKKTITTVVIVAVLVAASFMIIGQNHSVSTSDPAPSDMQVTSVPKTSTIPLQLYRMSGNGTIPALNATAWIPVSAVTAQIQSEMVDVSQYRTLSVLIAPWTPRQVNSNDTTMIFVSEIEKMLMEIKTYVTFVDPDTGAFTTVVIDQNTPTIPVAGPFAFVSLGSGHGSFTNTDPDQINAVLYLSS